MRDVAVIGVGQSKFGKFPEKNVVAAGAGSCLSGT